MYLDLEPVPRGVIILPNHLGNNLDNSKTPQSLGENVRDWRGAQQLRVPAVLPEDPGLIPSTHTVAHNHL